MKTNPLSDTYISNGIIIQGDPTNDATLTCGIRITGIALEHASNLQCSNLEDSFRSLLQCIPEDLRIQIRFTNSGDYTSELERYYQTTQSKANRWSKEQRNFRFLQSHEQFDSGKISRQEVHFFLSRKIKSMSTRGDTTSQSDEIEALLKAEAASFDSVFQQVKHAMKIVGGNAELLNDEELFLEFDKALNPSINPYDSKLALERFQPEHSICESCMHSDMTAVDIAGCAFRYDGNYHSIILLKTLPSLTSSGSITQLSALQIRNFEITVLTRSLNLESEISKEESKAAKLNRALGSSNKTRFRMALQKSLERIDRLSSGNAKPSEIQVIIHCWDSDPVRLQNEKVSVIKSAILRFQQAQYYSVEQPVMARNLFLSGLPGSPTHEPAFTHKTEDVTVANLLPISGNHDGTLKNAEAIYQTTNGGLFGISLFHDQFGNPFTNHGLVTGTTGFGKSCTTLDLLTQVQPHVETIFIIEDGNSYGSWVQTYQDEANSLFIDKNGSDVLNYFDTNGCPLTPQHFSDIANVHMIMTGRSADEDINISRQSMLTELSRDFYKCHLESWKRENLDRYQAILLDYAVMNSYRHLYGLRDNDTLFSDFLQWKRNEPDEYKLALASITNPIEEENEGLFHLVFAFMTRYEMPTHGMFCDWLENQSDGSGEINRIKSNLALWRADRGCGLFDGISTFSFTGRVVHIELGLISESDKQLKELSALIVSNYIRNSITRMNRSKRKLVIFEELSRFLTFDNAEHIVSDYYERGRKYSTCVLAVVQQITKIPETLRNSILGNSSLGIFFRSKTSTEAATIQESFQLPESTAISLMKMDKPSKQHGAHFICWQEGIDGAVIHHGRNIVSPEMLYVSDSGGEKYEDRKRALSAYADIIDGIKIESRIN